MLCVFVFFFQAEDGIRDIGVTGVQTCALPICEDGGYGGVRGVVAGGRADGRAPAGGVAPGRPARDRRRRGAHPRRTAEPGRSGERRVGEECRYRGAPYHLKKKKNKSTNETHM